jgi:hypothetical protein
MEAFILRHAANYGCDNMPVPKDRRNQRGMVIYMLFWNHRTH